jgi:energy-coupling factor transporter ATP-binding protein EcfA2
MPACGFPTGTDDAVGMDVRVSSDVDEATRTMTVEQALAELSARLFVGREREQATFQDWLLGDRALPEVLNVTGPGGVGKSELLRAFRRLAEEHGRAVVVVDGRSLRPTPDELLHALGSGSLDQVVADLNGRRPLILIDTAEALGDLTRYLRDELLPRLDVSVRVVIAGRYPLGHVWLRDGHWRALIRPLPLEGFAPDEARRYLTQRGLTEPTMIEQIRDAVGGYPLALSLAADLALQYGIRNFATAPAWRLAVRTLVEQLVSDLDAEMRELLEVCAIVRQFDQSMLESVAGHPHDDAAFGRLCRLSVIRPGPHGLVLHDDVRRILGGDLRWRHPERYVNLRLRAVTAYQERMRAAAPAEREWLVGERLSLWEDAFVQAFLFRIDEPSEVWLEPARPEDHDDVIRMEMTWQTQILPTIGTIAYPPGYSAEIHEALFAPLVACPGRRLTIARDRDGRAIGFSIALPLYERSVAILVDNPTLWPVLRAHLSPSELAALPSDPDRADRYILVQAAHIGVLPEATHAALFRDLLATLAFGRVHYVVAGLPAHRSLWESLGFEQIPGAESPAWLAEHQTFYGYVLDLRRIGFEAWIEAIVAGRQPPRALSPDELASALEQVLRQWTDDAALAGSPLMGSSLMSRSGVARPGPDDLRRAVRAALTAAQADAPEQDRLALCALELAYLERPASARAAAASLAVSRATFYRLLERGLNRLVSTLSGPAPA